MSIFGKIIKSLLLSTCMLTTEIALATDVIGVAVGAGGDGDAEGRILTTTDGLNWSINDKVKINHDIMSEVAWNGREWMAISLRGTIITSSDGITWSTHEISPQDRPFMRLSTLAWDGKQWLIGGSDGLNIAFWTSTDDNQWKKTHTTLSDSMQQYLKVAFDGEEWAAVVGWHAVGKILRSSDGINWTLQDTGTNMPLFGIRAIKIKRCQYKWIAVGNGAIISTDFLTTWVSANLPNYSYDDSGWNGKQFVLAGIDPLISTDGANWSKTNSDGRCLPHSLDWDNVHSRWVAVGYQTGKDTEQGCIMTSTQDGTQWTTKNSPDHSRINTLNSVAFKR